MNESDFETELRELCPVAPSASVEARIADALTGHPLAVVAPRTLHAQTAGVLAPRESTAARFFRGLGWACAGAAAAVATVAWLQQPSKPTTAPALAPVAALNADADAFEPDGSERELLDTTDEGVLLQDGAEPVRQLRYHYIERYAWTNPATGARVEVEVPREDIYLMPVAMQ